MNRFTEKWQECVRRARRQTPPDVSAPAGFSARIVSLHLQARRAPWENLWLRFSLPALTASALLLLLTSFVYWKTPVPSTDLLRPPLENAIIEQIRLL